MASTNAYPKVSPLGEEGLLVEFAPALTDEANRAALAFRAALDDRAPVGLLETTISLKGMFCRFDPDVLAHEGMIAHLSDMLSVRDWLRAPLPSGRRRYTVPACFSGDRAPQLDEVADLIGRAPSDLVAEVATTPLRVLTLGFAPGQPYLGILPESWDIPRQSALTPQVPAGAVVTAVRQIVMFTVSAQTGWRQIGQSTLAGYRPRAARPFTLRPGDEVLFDPVDEATLARWLGRATEGELAAQSEDLE